MLATKLHFPMGPRPNDRGLSRKHVAPSGPSPRSGAVRPAQIALAWLLGRPGVTAPIVGATSATHIDDAVAAVDLALSDEETERMEAPYRPHPILSHH